MPLAYDSMRWNHVSPIQVTLVKALEHFRANNVIEKTIYPEAIGRLTHFTDQELLTLLAGVALRAVPFLYVDVVQMARGWSRWTYNVCY